MSYYVRKIEIAKWRQNDVLNGASPSADAITGCLRTKFNTLSVWEIEDEGQLDDAILAITSQAEKADTIDVLMIDKEAIIRKAKYSKLLIKSCQ